MPVFFSKTKISSGSTNTMVVGSIIFSVINSTCNFGSFNIGIDSCAWLAIGWYPVKETRHIIIRFTLSILEAWALLTKRYMIILCFVQLSYNKLHGQEQGSNHNYS